MDNLQPFQLDPTGKCTSCAETASTQFKITCAKCAKHFHGYCSTANDTNYISKQTFMKAWHAPSVKPNFQWHCDHCLTKNEERAASKMEDRFDKLVMLVILYGCLSG